MSPEYLIALLIYILVTNMSPGPNKMLLVTSGIHFGLKRTFPQIFGIAAGISLTIFLVGFGFAKVFERYPSAYTTIKYLGVAYMFYLAWKIASASPVLPKQASDSPEQTSKLKPLGFFQATMMQWLNPKAWAVGVVSTATYVPQIDNQASYPHLFLVAGGFFSLSILTSAIWSGFGVQLRHWLSDPKHLRLFNWVMAAALVISVLPMVWN